VGTTGPSCFLGVRFAHSWRDVAARPKPSSRPWPPTATSATGSAKPTPSFTSGSCGGRPAISRARPGPGDFADRRGEAEVLSERGTLHRLSGEPAEAEAYHRQALELARTISTAQDEARPLVGLGRCAAAAGHTTQAKTLLQQDRPQFADMLTGIFPSTPSNWWRMARIARSAGIWRPPRSSARRARLARQSSGSPAPCAHVTVMLDGASAVGSLVYSSAYLKFSFNPAIEEACEAVRTHQEDPAGS
jgi:Tetratricopeptide repeat